MGLWLVTSSRWPHGAEPTKSLKPPPPPPPGSEGFRVLVGVRVGGEDERGGFYRGEVGFVSDQDRWGGRF